MLTLEDYNTLTSMDTVTEEDYNIMRTNLLLSLEKDLIEHTETAARVDELTSYTAELKEKIALLFAQVEGALVKKIDPVEEEAEEEEAEPEKSPAEITEELATKY